MKLSVQSSRRTLSEFVAPDSRRQCVVTGWTNLGVDPMASLREGVAAVSDLHRMLAGISIAMEGALSAVAAADQLCCACVDYFAVDGASLSVVHGGSTRGTLGSSGEMSRELDELQFTFGEGPCIDAVASHQPVSAENLQDPGETRWPAFTEALVGRDIHAVFALPVSIAGEPIGALDLFRHSSGPLSSDVWAGARLAARVAMLPLLDLMTMRQNWDGASQGGAGWGHLAPLERVEVYQATGMIIAALDVPAEEALVRLRAYAFAHEMTASEVAWSIVERRLSLSGDEWHREDRSGG